MTTSKKELHIYLGISLSKIVKGEEGNPLYSLCTLLHSTLAQR